MYLESAAQSCWVLIKNVFTVSPKIFHEVLVPHVQVLSQILSVLYRILQIRNVDFVLCYFFIER